MSQFFLNALGAASGFVQTITGNDGLPVAPTAGNINIIGATVANGINAIPLYVKRTASDTDTIQAQVASAIASTNINNTGLAAFDSASFGVDANGFVTFIGVVWTDENASFSALKNKGYFVTATATATLPASPAQGDTIEFAVDSASGILTIQAVGSQTIQSGPTVSAAAGIAVSNFNGDTIKLVYRAADTNWIAVSRTGTWSIT